MSMHMYVEKDGNQIMAPCEVTSAEVDRVVFRPRNEDGVEEPYFTKLLNDALIVGISPSKSPGSYVEELTLAYGKISWTFEKGGISASDTLADAPGA